MINKIIKKLSLSSSKSSSWLLLLSPFTTTVIVIVIVIVITAIAVNAFTGPGNHQPPNGSGTLSSVLIPSNIKSGVSLLGVLGTYTFSDANLIPENIKSGISIFGVAGTLSGIGSVARCTSVYSTGGMCGGSAVGPFLLLYDSSGTASQQCEMICGYFLGVTCETTTVNATPNMTECRCTNGAPYRLNPPQDTNPAFRSGSCID